MRLKRQREEGTPAGSETLSNSEVSVHQPAPAAIISGDENGREMRRETGSSGHSCTDLLKLLVGEEPAFGPWIMSFLGAAFLLSSFSYCSSSLDVSVVFRYFECEMKSLQL